MTAPIEIPQALAQRMLALLRDCATQLTLQQPAEVSASAAMTNALIGSIRTLVAQAELTLGAAPSSADAPPAPETHSPLPWRVVNETGDFGDQVIRDARGHEVLAMGPSMRECLDAALIVRSVNALPILVQQLRACAARFREYAETHTIKGAHDKAARNQVMAAECEKAIALAEEPR